MVKYKIIFFGYGGSLYDAFPYGVILEDLEADDQMDCFKYLEFLNSKDLLRKDLKFVVLPVFVVA